MLKEKIITIIQQLDDNELLLFILVFLEDTLNLEPSDVTMI